MMYKKYRGWPAYFDVGGVIIWILLIIDATWQLAASQPSLVGWRVWAEFGLGILGLVVDGGLLLFAP